MIYSPISECYDLMLLIFLGSLVPVAEMAGEFLFIMDLSLFSAGPGFFSGLASSAAVAATVGLVPFLRMAENIV